MSNNENNNFIEIGTTAYDEIINNDTSGQDPSILGILQVKETEEKAIEIAKEAKKNKPESTVMVRYEETEPIEEPLEEISETYTEYFEEDVPELPVEQKKNNIALIIGIIIGILVIIVGYILLKTDKIRKGIFSVIVIIDIIGLLVLWIIYG